MKALFINAVAQNIETINLENVEAIPGKLGNCRFFKGMSMGGGLVMMIDEEGLLRNWTAGFCYNGSHPLAGNGLVLGINEEGEYVDYNGNTEEIAGKIKFLGRETMILLGASKNEPFMADMSNEGIAKYKAEAAERAKHAPKKNWWEL